MMKNPILAIAQVQHVSCCQSCFIHIFSQVSHIARSHGSQCIILSVNISAFNSTSYAFICTHAINTQIEVCLFDFKVLFFLSFFHGYLAYTCTMQWRFLDSNHELCPESASYHCFSIWSFYQFVLFCFVYSMKKT